MNRVDWMLLMPEIVLSAGGVLVLMLEAIAPKARRSFTLLSVLATVAAAWAAYIHTLPAAPLADPAATFGGLLETSPVAFAFSMVVLLATALALLASDGYLRREGILSGEYHALLLWCAAGLLLTIRATELLTIFLALELFSLCLYCLAVFHRRISIAGEAAIKYFLMGAFVSAFVLYGIALVYGATGSTRLGEISARLASSPDIPVLASLGFLMLVAGFGFKMSVVPFHAWSPDTYQGAPSPFVAFLSVAPKVASALVVYRFLDAIVVGEGVASNAYKWSTVVAALAVLSMLVGNLLALVQRDIKRMLAYSGVAHMGYLLLALVVLDRDSLTPMLVYLLAYVLMNAGAFAVVAMLYNRPGEQHLISDLGGWGYRYPLLGGCLAICMLSLGGIPPTMGFLGKYVVFLNAVGDGLIGLAVLGVVASLVGVFYYLRVVYYLYMKPETRQPEGLLIDVWGRTAAVLAAVGTLVLGLWPTGLLQWLITATTGQ
jgi:NADH-quinone oxidoreductase subunit N